MTNFSPLPFRNLWSSSQGKCKKYKSRKYFHQYFRKLISFYMAGGLLSQNLVFIIFKCLPTNQFSNFINASPWDSVSSSTSSAESFHQRNQLVSGINSSKIIKSHPTMRIHQDRIRDIDKFAKCLDIFNNVLFLYRLIGLGEEVAFNFILRAVQSTRVISVETARSTSRGFNDSDIQSIKRTKGFIDIDGNEYNRCR